MTAFAFRRYWFPWALIVIGLIWLGAIAGQWTVTLGKVWVIRGDYNAGRVLRGTIIEHRVWLFNPSRQPVSLQLEPSCGCTVITEAGSSCFTLAPLRWQPITIRIETAGLKLGEHRQVVWVKFSSDKRVPLLQPIWVRFRLEDPPLPDWFPKLP